MKKIGCVLITLALFAMSVECQSYEKAKVWLVDQGPVIGADLSFWDGLEGTKVDLRPWGGAASDASGVCTFAADGKNLYFLARVTDSAPQANKKSTDMTWDKTSVEFCFGTNTKNHTSYQSGDNQVRFFGKDKADPASVGAVKNGTSLNAKKYSANIMWGEKSYVIQAAIPYDVLGIKELVNGQGVRCEFRINHANEGANRSIIVNWRTDGDAAYKDPSVWSDGVVVQAMKK